MLYQFRPPMLLNEYQKQERTIDGLRAQVAALTRAIVAGLLGTVVMVVWV